MKRKHHWKNSFLKKMLFSIVGLICIPMICIQLYMIVTTNQEFRQENTAYYQRAVQSMALSFDKQLSSLSASAYRMQLDQEILRPLTEDVKGYDLQALARKIDDYALDSPMVDVVGVYYAGKDMVLYKGTRHTLQEVCNKIFPADSQSSEDLAALLRGESDADILYSGAYANAGIKQMIVAKTLETGSGKDRQMTAFFLIRDNVFERWCDVFVPNGQSFAIFDEDGKHILGSYDFFSEIGETASFQAYVRGLETVYTEHPDVLVYKCQEVETGFTYMTCVSRDTVEEQLNGYTAQAVRSIVIAVILSAILLCVTLYINYMPVRRIVKKHIAPDPRKSNVSELELINTHLFAQDERITSQNQLLESFIAGDLLSGNGANAEDVEKHFPASTYTGFAVALSPLPMTTAQSARVCKTFAGRENEKLVITTVPYRAEMVFVYACNGPVDITAFQSQLERAIANEMGQIPAIRCGKAVSNIFDIPGSYTDAVLTNRSEAEPGDHQPEGYPQALVGDFAFHLSNGEWEHAISGLDKLERINHNMKPALRRFVHLKVLNLFLINVPKSGQALSNTQANQLLAYTNGQHLYNMMRRMMVDFKVAKANAVEEGAGELRSKLLEYVDQNFASNELCLSSAADYLKTSIYTVSRIFKEITGCGFKEYITEKRLQYACALLKKSGMPISEVGAACGFDNAEYFTVIFCNRFGIAPSKFRKEAAEQADGPEPNSQTSMEESK